MNYLYNGIEFPELPKTEYEYAFIYRVQRRTTTSVSILVCLGQRGTVNADIGPGVTNYMYFPEVTERTPYLSYIKKGDAWELDEEGIIYLADDNSLGYVMNLDVLSVNATKYFAIEWSNFDILYRTANEDAGIAVGDIYLAASDPVPVGGVAPDIDPKAFMEGLRIGQIVRAMRL